jgi:DNA polymerase-3 subunit delta'
VSEAIPDEPDRLDGAPHPREAVRLFGQEEAEARFLAALAGGRPHHAWLITGPRGVGKATLAWRIARHMVSGAAGNSLDMASNDPVFRRVAALGHPQVLLCRRPWDEKGERLRTVITVDEVRALKGFFQLSAADAGWRVAIVDAADELNESAANALLKILEEPPPRAVLLLVSHRPSLLLPTVRSRCRELRCRPLDPPALAAALAQAGAPADAEDALAKLTGGSVGTAMRLMASDGVTIYGEILALIGRAPPADRRRAIALAEACAGRTAAARYDLTLELVQLALSRLALAGAGGEVAPATDAEAGAMTRLGATPGQARIWAAAVTRIADRTGHARAVNLDPAQVILDTFLQIDAAATEAIARAA